MGREKVRVRRTAVEDDVGELGPSAAQLRRRASQRKPQRERDRDRERQKETERERERRLDLLPRLNSAVAMSPRLAETVIPRTRSISSADNSDNSSTEVSAGVRTLRGKRYAQCPGTQWML